MLTLENSFSGKLVEYYDMFFLKDNVCDEVKYVLNMINKCIEPKRLLDVGCGTGLHAKEFSKYFTHVLGIDISKDMILYAQEKHQTNNVTYRVADVRKISVNDKYEVVTALSHVIGYQITNSDVEKMLLGVNNALEKGGIFVFNFYNEPQILTGKLNARTKVVENDSIKISRFSNATLDVIENVLLLDYYYFIEEKKESTIIPIEIHEKMRYFSLKEMAYYLEKMGFEIINAFDWNYDKNQVNENISSWNVGIIAKKI